MTERVLKHRVVRKLYVVQVLEDVGVFRRSLKWQDWDSFTAFEDAEKVYEKLIKRGNCVSDEYRLIERTDND